MADAVLVLTEITDPNTGALLAHYDEDGFVVDGDFDVSGTFTPAGNVAVGGTLTVTGATTLSTASTITTGTTIGNLTLGDGSIVDSSGAISFGDEALTTTGIITSAGISTTANTGTSAATSVVEHGNGVDHVTVLTATALAWPDTPDGSSLALGDLIYTFPTGDILVEHVYMNIIPNPASTENDAVVADVGIGTTIATAAVAILSGTAATEDFITGQSVTVDSSNGANVITESTGGGPMYIEASDDHTLHVNIAGAWQTSADNSIDYTGTVVLIWKYLGA